MPDVVIGPDLPCRVDPYASVTWDVDGDLLDHVPDGVPFTGFAERHRPGRWWMRKSKRGTMRQYRTPYSEMKGSR